MQPCGIRVKTSDKESAPENPAFSGRGGSLFCAEFGTPRTELRNIGRGRGDRKAGSLDSMLSRVNNVQSCGDKCAPGCHRHRQGRLPGAWVAVCLAHDETDRDHIEIVRMYAHQHTPCPADFGNRYGIACIIPYVAVLSRFTVYIALYGSTSLRHDMCRVPFVREHRCF